MYSPVRKDLKANREGVKEQKKQQLSVLLINKFRNKFNVVSTTETDIDKLIVSEVTNLINQGSGTQAALGKLDEKLSNEIKEMRKKNRTTGNLETGKLTG